MPETKRRSGVGSLLLAQLLLGVLVYVALIFYPSEPRLTLLIIYLLILGILYFSWKGLKGLWG